MKKLFSMAVIFTMVLTLAACKPDKEVGVNELSFTFTDEFGFASTETITYEEGFDGDFMDLLILNFDFEYSNTEYGYQLDVIEHLHPMTGAYVSISKNEVMSEVGIDLIEFEEGDSFQFDLVWWDPLQQGVNDLITLFLVNHASDYVNSESVDYAVLLGLNLLGIESSFVSKVEVEEIVVNKTLTTVTDYFKAIMMLNAVGSDSELLISELNTFVVPGPYGQTAYGLIAIDSLSYSVNFGSFVTDALNDLDTTTPLDLGLDAGGISLVALSNYGNVEHLVNVYATWIKYDQLPTGGIATRDTVWGETTYLGTENASSMSQVILGLLANGIDPAGVDYTKGTNNLISRLLEFSTDTGSFDYVLDDEITEDLAFSTPQAFLALVAYQVYANTSSAVNPYDFN